MTWRMEGLTRQVWQASITQPWPKAAARCEECGWGIVQKSPCWAGRLARAHTRETGHATRTAHVKVTQYRKAA